jgi:hypothetical protein
MRTRNLEKQAVMACLAGAGLWATIAVLAGFRRAPFGVIELLLLFAVLVIVPLGFNLSRVRGSDGDENHARVPWLLAAAAALGVVVSLWQRPGPVTAVFSIPWFVLGVWVALAGVWNLYRRATRSLTDVAASVAGVDLALAAGWLVVSRAGLHPMGFQEPIVLLTAVHFHYSGFATALIAAAALRMQERVIRPSSDAGGLSCALVAILAGGGFRDFAGSAHGGGAGARGERTRAGCVFVLDEPGSSCVGCTGLHACGDRCCLGCDVPGRRLCGDRLRWKSIHDDAGDGEHPRRIERLGICAVLDAGVFD